MSHAPLALLLVLSLLAAAATTPAQRPPPRYQQLPTGDHPKPLTNAKVSVGGRSRASQGRGGGGLDFMRFLSVVTGPQIQLLGPMNIASLNLLDQLGSYAGADAILTLFTASAGASSGGIENPAFAGTADSSEEVQDLVV